MKREIRTTADGSKTLFVEALDEHYHSYHGALQEAQHVFLKMGLHALSKDHLDILEIGFGTGLNAWLTALEVVMIDTKVHYIGVEGFPVSRDEWESLDYPKLITDERGPSLFEKIHVSDWETANEILPGFQLTKVRSDFREFSPEGNSLDLIFFDAFAPDAQPELWTTAIFQGLYKCLREGGLLVTYSAKGQVRRNMIEAGFKVEKVPGPPGKREMLRAWKGPK
ncbi:MAG: tRNA (5-methylaminomethyl-2-thiouridine)(34)-methyltransferase MnmD [Bacteroidota bacterium]|nr:tRNA (5-methylaminomethyl-2-thiouridine)(34)-methyltransferase MnmD [Bacteroidota bacterium]MDX5505495.1 tRNA (5-methylaminomethyl-2-thiouridine)(34)-methyltransferase MnmD [Bacteroidota bacterium]